MWSDQDVFLNIIRFTHHEAHDEQIFREFKGELQISVKLAHRHQSKEICICTDASDEFCAAAVTKCEKTMLYKNIAEKIHQRLSFLGSRFKGSQENWTTFKNEAFAIYEVFCKLEYLLIISHKE